MREVWEERAVRGTEQTEAIPQEREQLRPNLDLPPHLLHDRASRTPRDLPPPHDRVKTMPKGLPLRGRACRTVRATRRFAFGCADAAQAHRCWSKYSPRLPKYAWSSACCLGESCSKLREVRQISAFEHAQLSCSAIAAHGQTRTRTTLNDSRKVLVKEWK